MTLSVGELIGFGFSVFGILFSIWLFREQQKTDFNTLKDTINSMRYTEIKEVAASIAVIRSCQGIQEQIQIKEDMARLKDMIGNLNCEIQGLPSKIASDLRQEQKALLDTVYQNINKSVDESRKAVKQAVQTELSGLMPNQQQQQIAERLTDLVSYALFTMAKHQRSMIASETEKATNKVVVKIETDLKSVKNDVENLNQQATSLLSVIIDPNQ